MTCIAQLYVANTTSKNSCELAGQRWVSSSHVCVNIGTRLNQLAAALQVIFIGLCAWSRNSIPKCDPRHAYLLSELRDCSVGRRLLYQREAGWLLKLKEFVVSSLRTVWRWC
jgi:hypothetical protein